MAAISVIIPTCHRNDLLALCLDRLAPGRQTLSCDSYEVIVTDDGTVTTAQSMILERYPWAKWVAGPRKGPAANRNNGAAHAVGEWLAFTDDDCLPNINWLAAFAEIVLKNKTGQVFEGRTTCEAGLKSPLVQAPINLDGGWLWSCNLMVSKVFFNSLGGFDSQYPAPHMEDVDFRERIIRNNSKFVFVPEASVDHPPRPIVRSSALARAHECEVIFRQKFGIAHPSFIAYLFRTLRLRIRLLTRERLSNATFIAAKIYLGEFWIILNSYRRWLRKYSVEIKRLS